MASANQYYYGNNYQFHQPQQSSSGGAFNQINGGWNSAAHTAFNPFPSATSSASMPNSEISRSHVGLQYSDDWEIVQTDFCSTYLPNNHCSSVTSANSNSNSGYDDEEWILDDTNNQGSWASSDQFSPQMTCPQYFGFEDENIDEGFQSQGNASSSQLTYTGQEECYDDGCYMGNGYYNDHFAVAEDFDEEFQEPEMPTPFVKKPVKRDWCGNAVFQDDWNLGVKSSTGSYSSSSGNNADEEVRTILKRRCNRSMI